VTEAHRLCGDLAWLWPILSPPEDYAEEAGRGPPPVHGRAGVRGARPG
jgi:hypothetical protein